MQSVCYIVFSPFLGSYYIGVTSEGELSRLEKHNLGFYRNAYTRKTDDWQLFHVIAADDFAHALRIERKIKQMKSKRYIENLKQYTELTAKVIQEARQRT